MLLLLRNSQLLKVGRSLLGLFSGTSFLLRNLNCSRRPLSPRAVQWHVVPAEKPQLLKAGRSLLGLFSSTSLSLSSSVPCQPLLPGFSISLANRRSRALSLYPSLADAHEFPKSPKHDALAVELCPLPTAAPGLLHFPKSDALAQFLQNPRQTTKGCSTTCSRKIRSYVKHYGSGQRTASDRHIHTPSTRKRTISREIEFRDIGLDGTSGKFCQGRVFVLKMFSRDPRVQLASLLPRKTIGLGAGALESQPLRSIAMFTPCRIHAPFSLRELRRRFISLG